MKLTRKTWLAIVAGAVLASPAAIAADHQDGSNVIADPAADITDVFAWMTDATHVALIMDVMPGATSTSQFTNAVQYVFHTTTYAPSPGIPALGGQPDDEIDVTCTFDTSGNPSCWVAFAGDTGTGSGADALDYVSGTAAQALTGITSSDGLVQLFAGPRNDPFFFNLDGYKQTIADVEAAVPTLVTDNAFNVAGCPNLSVLPAGTVAALDTQLATAADGGAPQDAFAGNNVLSIVLNINTSVLLQVPGDTLLAVWGSTNS